jgi:hypothetical protein
MATLSALDHRGDLFRLDPALPPNELELRMIYLSPKLKTWLADVLPGVPSDWDVELTPAEELSQLVESFCSGVVLIYDKDLKPIRYVKDGVWELRTIDLRLFGWFPMKDHFVGVVANTAKFIHDHEGIHTGYAGEVCRFREGLDLDDPKYVRGRDVNAVVSNCHYA